MKATWKRIGKQYVSSLNGVGMLATKRGPDAIIKGWDVVVGGRRCNGEYNPFETLREAQTHAVEAANA